MNELDGRGVQEVSIEAENIFLETGTAGTFHFSKSRYLSG